MITTAFYAHAANLKFSLLVGNGATWDRFEPRTKILKKKLKKFEFLNSLI